MLDGIERYLTTAAMVAAAVAAIYRFMLTQKKHEQIHLVMTKALDNLRSVSWIEDLQRSLKRVSAIFTFVYGPTKSDQNSIFSFMTQRAWQTSALIVACVEV